MKILTLKHFMRVACVLAAFIASSGWANAESAAEFYQGKTVKLVVGYGAGGGYDTYARMLAPHFEKRLGATVVVENRPGGGGMVVISQVAASPGDGLTMVLANFEAASLGQILDSPGIRFDVTELPVLGRVSGEPKVLLLSKESPFRTVADLQAAKDPIKWAGGGKTDGIADVAAIFSEAFGLNAKIIIGYKGAKESALAAIRGEVDGLFSAAGTAQKLVKNGQLLPIAVMDRKRSPFFPELPTIFELTSPTAEQAWWIDYRAGLTELGRTLLTAPGTPADRVALLRGVVAQTLSDPAVVAEADKKRRPLGFSSADETEDRVAKTITAVSKSDIDRLRRVILDKYY